MSKSVSIIGAGLAGCEAALQLSSMNYKVNLYDSKPERLLTIYNLPTYAELVCNNSMGAIGKKYPLGVLALELKCLGSKLINIAEKNKLDDEKFLSVDRKAFSKDVTNCLKKNGVNIINKHICNIPEDDYVIIATGPLTDEKIISFLQKKYNIEKAHFSDASCAIVDINSIDIENSLVTKISNDVYLVSFPKKLFEIFCNELVFQNKLNSVHSIDKSFDFEKCQSIESLAQNGTDVLYKTRFKHDYFDGPCLMLRRECALNDGFIMVGCTTTLGHAAQKKIFSIIPGFKNCRIIKYGRMHRNTYFDSPKTLNHFFQINNTNTFIIGQLSGIDGYLPAIASGLVASIKIIYGKSSPKFPKDTMIGGLANYISNNEVSDFQPMCASFSLLENSYYNIDSILKYVETLKKLRE